MTHNGMPRCSRCGEQAQSSYTVHGSSESVPFCGYCLHDYMRERTLGPMHLTEEEGERKRNQTIQRRRSMAGRYSEVLIDAVCAEDLRTMECLLDRDANPDAQSAEWDAPLPVAAAPKNTPAVAPFIERFASACLSADGPWPAPFEMPDPDDILALQTLLKNEGVAVTADRLFCLVSMEIAQQRRRQFSQSFMECNRNLPPQPTLEDWAYAFVNTFQSSLDHLSDLADMVDESGIRIDRQQLAELVNQAILAQSHERRVEKISQAMRNGAPIRRLSIEDVDCMDGLEFEHFLCKLFKALGYQAQVTRASGDQGADLVLEKLGERTVVQAKRFADRVSNSAVQEVVAAKAQYRCHQAMVVSNSYFTSPAAELAAANGVTLWDRDKLTSAISMHL